MPVGGDVGLTLPRGRALTPGAALTLTFSRGGGRYRLVVTLVGDGLTDTLERTLRIGRAPVAARLLARLTPAGWAPLVRPAAAARLTGRIEVASAPPRYTVVRGLPARRLAKGREASIALGDLTPGRYPAVVRLNGGPPLTRGFRVTA